MGVTHVNRKGETYHLLVGRTKTGKPKYYVSKKPGDNAAETIPEGYELYEQPPDAIVHVRKVRPTNLTEFEREQVVSTVRTATGKEHFLVGIEEDSIVVYWPDRDPGEVASVLQGIMGFAARGTVSISDWTVKHTRYQPLMRFVLVDADERRFVAERMCFRGGRERWLPLSGRRPLGEVVAELAPHLGQETFFELF